MEHWIWNPIPWTVPILRVISNEQKIVQQLGLIWMSLVYSEGLLALSLLCDMRCSTMEKLSWELLIHWTTLFTSQSKDSTSQNESKWKFQWRKRRTVIVSQNNRMSPSDAVDLGRSCNSLFEFQVVNRCVVIVV